MTTTVQPQGRLLTVAQVRKRIIEVHPEHRFSRERVYQLIESGDLPFVQPNTVMGGASTQYKYLVSERALNDFLRDRGWLQ